MRWYKGLTYHWQAFIKTVIISFMLVWPPYNMVYFIFYTHTKANTMAKQEPMYTSDFVRSYVKKYNKRKSDGSVEFMPPEEIKK
jgi:hypothetical protein